MNNYPIFYVVHAQFYENSDQNCKKRKKITEIFSDLESKKLRNKALVFCREIIADYLVKNNVSSEEYYLNYVFEKNDINKTSIEDVLFFTSHSKLNLSLIVSFGIVPSVNVELKNSKILSFPELFPILAVGESLHLVENSLKANLLLERKYYKFLGLSEPKIHKLPDAFISKDFLKDVLLRFVKNYNNNLSLSFINEMLYTTNLEFFPTFQFYKMPEKKLNSTNDYKTIFENLEIINNNNYICYKKRFLSLLKRLSKLLKIDLISLKQSELKNYLNNSEIKLSRFLVKEQLNVIKEIKTEVLYNFPLKEEIKRWL